MPWASLEYAPTQLLAGPPTDPLPNNELFMLTSMAPQEDDPLAFLNLDIRMPSVHNWGSGDQNSNRCEPLHATGTRDSKSSWLNSTLGNWSCGVDSSVPSRVGQDEEKGRLDPGTWRSGMDNLYSQPQEIPDVQSDDSPWPHIYKLKDQDVGVSLASLSTPLAAAALVPAENDILGTSRGTMAAIAQDSSWAIWPSVDIGNLPSVQAVTTPANLYNQYLHNLLLSYPDYSHCLASGTAPSLHAQPLYEGLVTYPEVEKWLPRNMPKTLHDVLEFAESMRANSVSPAHLIMRAALYLLNELRGPADGIACQATLMHAVYADPPGSDTHVAKTADYAFAGVMSCVNAS
ncbi:hypothetical protein EHS25_005644 [Saitozyma podzolica]|uniref:Uncharacterized protein n=1 Tax=Saitozyma podzolica TaxID=1890683 RepID=A0A427XW44_9TREE|nr:hypothetical protein EHS25_005644 [Saitozyma podzolica]